MHNPHIHAERTADRIIKWTTTTGNRLLILALVVSVLLSSIVDAKEGPANRGSPIRLLHESPLTNPYVQVFPANLSGFSPFLISPVNETSAWFVAVKFRSNAPPLSEILSFTTRNGPSEATPPFTGIPAAIYYNQTNLRTRIWVLENDSLEYYDPVARDLKIEYTFLGGSAESMTIDNHGMIWMTLLETSQIVEYDPSQGHATYYALPSPESEPSGIAVAPDQSVWFTEVNGSRLGHLTPGESGTPHVAEYAPPSSIHVLFPIQTAVDREGSVWFTDHGTNQFGNFNPVTGEWRVFPIGYCREQYNPDCAVGLPNAISLDQKGRLWFSEHFAGRIAQYDPVDGRLSEYIVPATTTPYTWWMWPGPGGLVWFTAFGTGHIGYVNASVPVPISLNTTSTIDLQQGGTKTLSVTVLTPQSPVSLNISVNDVDNPFGSPPLLYGRPDQGQIGPSSNQISATFSITASWDLSLGDRNVALTAYNSYVDVNMFIRVRIVQTFTPFLGLGMASTTVTGSVLLYWRRPRKLKSNDKDEAGSVLD